MNWRDKAVVREYKRLQQRKYRNSTRTQERQDIDWKDRLQVRAYKRKNYAKNSLRWCHVVAKYLGRP